MKVRDLVLIVSAAPAFLGFAACSGGAGAPLQSAIPTASNAALRDVPTIATARTRVALSVVTSTGKHVDFPSSVVLMWKGTNVGHFVSGSNHRLFASVESRVKPGATLLAQTGTFAARFLLAHSGRDTAVLVTLQPKQKQHVTTASGLTPQSNPASTDPNGSAMEEDSNGDVLKVKLSDGGTLPSDLPFSFSLTCATMTLTPNAGETFSSMKFEESVEDGGSGNDTMRRNDDGGSGSSSGSNDFKYEGPFSGPQTFPLIANSTVKLELFQNNESVFKLEAPIAAFGTPTGDATPCPSAAPSATPSAEPSDSPEPSESPS